MDIGFGAISGTFEQGHDFTYVCMDNEAYMKTGVQSSGGTLYSGGMPYDASTTTTPAGKFSFGNPFPKKNMPTIMAALTSLRMWLQTL
jgi:pyruvate ferredoxin oxidoreductase beta subunit